MTKKQALSEGQVRARLALFTPSSITPVAWRAAQEAVGEVVVAARPSCVVEASLLASRLCGFLAGTSVDRWDRASAPDLSSLLTEATIDAATTQAALPGLNKTSRDGYRVVLRRLYRAQAGRPFTALSSPAKATAQAVGFWPAVVSHGSFSALAEAYCGVGNALTGSCWAGIEQDLVWDLAMLVSKDHVIVDRDSTALEGDRGKFERVQASAVALRDATYPKGRPSARVEVSRVDANATTSSTRVPRPPSAAAARRIAKERQAAREAAAQREADRLAGLLPSVNAPPPLAEALAIGVSRWKPQGMPDATWAPIAEATRTAIAAFGPTSKATLANCRPPIGAFTAFAFARPERTRTGPLDVAELIEEGLIDAFLTGPLGDAPDPSRATARSVLRRVVRSLASGAAPERIAYAPVQPPYTLIEAATFVRLARNQPTDPLRRSLSAMVALGLGAGLGAEDQREVAPRDITEVELPGYGPALVVVVRGDAPRGRIVIVRAEYVDLLREALKLHAKAGRGAATPLCGLKPDRRNGANRVAAKAVTASATGIDVSAARLRATWLVACMSSPVPLGALLHAAGLRTPRTLADLLAYCPSPDPAAVAAALAAAGRGQASS